MKAETEFTCSCGASAFGLAGEPIIATECHCTSCRTAAERLKTLPDAAAISAPNGGTPFVLWRKDRVRCLRGAQHLRSFRLTSDSPTERVVAVCCNAPMYLSFKHGHWLSLYAMRWPDGSGPAPTERTMTGDRTDRHLLSDDIPNPRRHSLTFFAKLLWAWARMGFRNPSAPAVKEKLNA